MLTDRLSKSDRIFIDTAPIIYYMEAHPVYGAVVKQVVDLFSTGKPAAFSSVITLAEVLPKPIENGNEKLVRKFIEFMKFGRNFHLIDLNADIAEQGGRLRGKYPFLRMMDALQVAVSLDVGADVFLTNDVKLSKIQEIEVIVLNDYIL